MPRTIDPNAFPFTYFANSIADQKLSIQMVCDKIEEKLNVKRDRSSIYNWLNSKFLLSAVFDPRDTSKDDVAVLIAAVTGDSVPFVRNKIREHLVSCGKLTTGGDLTTYKALLADFAFKVRNIDYYDKENFFTSQQKAVISAAIQILESV